MYETHFGFHRQPFQSVDLAKLFYRSESIRGLLPRLTRCLRSSLGIGMVTALHGAGRSGLLRYLKTSMEHEGRTVFVSGSGLGSATLLHQLLMHCAVSHAGVGLAVESVSADISRWGVAEHLRRSMDFWGPVLLLIDDVHLVPISVLNELRALSEEDWNGRTLLRILVSAPVTFEVDLSRPEYENFSHRIRCHEFLQPLTTQESFEFLKRQIESAGPAISRTFSEKALEFIVYACEGLPKSLCLLTDESLAIAAEEGMRPVEEDCVRAALNRMKHLSCHWNTSVLESFSDEQTWETSSGGAFGESQTGFEHPSVSDYPTSGQILSAGVLEIGGTPLAPPPLSPLQNNFSMLSWETIPGPPPLPESAFAAGSEFPATESFGLTESTLEFHGNLTDHDGEFSESVEYVEDTSENGPEGFAMGIEAIFPEYMNPVVATPDALMPAIAELADSLPPDEQQFTDTSSELQIDPVDYSTLVPVPDRYTWIALGREGFSGDFSLMNTEYSGSLPDPELFLPSEILNNLPVQNSIPVQTVTDQEILNLLGRHSDAAVEGVYRVPVILERSLPAAATHPEPSVPFGSFHVIRQANKRDSVELMPRRNTKEDAVSPTTESQGQAPEGSPKAELQASASEEKITLPMWRDGSLLHSLHPGRKTSEVAGNSLQDSSASERPMLPATEVQGASEQQVSERQHSAASAKPTIQVAARANLVFSEPADNDSEAAGSAESSVADRFSTLFTRLRNLRSQKPDAP
ncbi:MAG: AAA family ATPase [Planctomycetia bacterium]